MEAALLFDDVTKRYGAVTALDGLSLAARRGEIMGFLGPNGAGKTTSIRIALGLIAATSGRVQILGVTDPAAVRNRIGLLPEERGLYRRMTPVAAIAFLAALKGVPSAEGARRARTLLEAHGLGPAMDRQIRSLSKGMAQKVQLLSAIVHEPELVILDEPFSGLDPAAQLSLEQLLRDLTGRGATVVFSTHVMEHAERICDHVVLIAAGRKVFDGSVDAARAGAPRSIIMEGAFEASLAGALPGVADWSAEALSQGGVRVVAHLMAGARPEETLRAAFARRLQITRIEAREASLRDAFIRLTSPEERDEPMAEAAA
ncbi:MAG TPA: ATP-binding cassette domain-containing protein [Caulobacteraceae bacterium]|nr:ATP-binding cassette domain-containing protein [Caulobacteraceae bacterium]